MLRGKDCKEDYKDYKKDYKKYKDDFKDIKEELEDLMEDLKEHKDLKDHKDHKDLKEHKHHKDYKDDFIGGCKSYKGKCSHGKKSDCLEDCLENPAKYSCNVFCKDTSENCYESYKLFDPRVYAKAYIQPQPYRNFFNLDNALIAGTIFKDLYNPYCDSGYVGGKRSYDE